ncbi:hypothetical protein TEA_016047 [Camellia sinensis var. sinensis]|uniref:Ubiquitin-like protease family profile domain-containing protein n=1 Tax=Camellia sinensis var. sinensis TaxID=542762 RepID=A0A4S4E6M7_CAMSN|nr:hypothetical protein TEA_016047 [Camellia sinensis var. sinensis]
MSWVESASEGGRPLGMVSNWKSGNPWTALVPLDLSSLHLFQAESRSIRLERRLHSRRGDRHVAVVCPGYVVYRGTYYTESVLIFSSSCIELKGSTAYGKQGTFSFQLGINEIVDIESQWCERLDIAMVKLRLISQDTMQAQDVHDTSGQYESSSVLLKYPCRHDRTRVRGIEELQFAIVDLNWYKKQEEILFSIEELQFTIVDLNWYKKQEEILSLDVRYKALWNVVFKDPLSNSGVDFTEPILFLNDPLLAPNGQLMEIDPISNTVTLPLVISIVGGSAVAFTSWEVSHQFFDEPFEEVVYPKGDSDAVSISKRDVDLLQPDTFVNDTIIDFYIKYLKNEMKPEERHRFFFFNSFFFRKLIDLDKDPPSSFEGRAAFQRVRKWTRKVNLFEKDYVLIPVNFNYHWSLIVICHPDEDVEKSLKVPCILHMDSIKGNHTGLKDFIQSSVLVLVHLSSHIVKHYVAGPVLHSAKMNGFYSLNGTDVALLAVLKHFELTLCVELTLKILGISFCNPLPQQQNSFDCGLFLLHYVERFLDEAPLNFSPFKITKFSNFLQDTPLESGGDVSASGMQFLSSSKNIVKTSNWDVNREKLPSQKKLWELKYEDFLIDLAIWLNVDWFPAAEPSLKRVHIEKLINKILEGENSPAACSGKPCASNYQANTNMIKTSVEFISERCTPLKSFHGNLSSSRVGQGIEMTLLPTSSQCAADSGLVLREFFEEGVNPGSFFDGQYRTFDRSASFGDFKGAISSMEVDAEAGGQFVYSPSNRTGFQQLAGITPGACGFSYPSRDFGADASWHPGIHQAGHEDINASPETSICASDDSLEVEVRETDIVREDLNVEEKKIDQPRSPSPENVECLTETLVSAPREMLDVADSQPSDHMLDSKTLGSAARDMLSVADSQPPDHMLDSITLVSAASEMLSVIDSQPLDHMLDSKTLASAASEMQSVADSQPPDHMLDSKTLASAASEMQSVADSQPPDHMLDSVTLVSAASEMLSVIDSQPPDHMLDSKTLVSAASEMLSVADSQPPDHMLHSKTLVSAAREMLSVADSQPPDHMLDSKTLASAASEMQSVADSQPPDHMLDSITLVSAASEMLSVADSQPPDHMLRSKTLVSAAREMLSVADSQPPDHMLDSKTLASAASEMLIVADSQPPDHMLDSKTLVSAPLSVADSQPPDHMLDSITLVSAASDMLTVTDCQPSNLMLDPKTLVSAPSEMLDVADAETSDHMVDSNGNADHLIPGLSDQGCDVQENGDITCADVSLIGDTKVSESDGQQVLEKIDDNSVSETDVQRTTKRIGDDSVSESDAQQQHEDANKIGHDSVLESDEVQPATTKRIADDLVVTQSDEMQAAKKARLTPPVEEERRQMRSLSKDLQL